MTIETLSLELANKIIVLRNACEQMEESQYQQFIELVLKDIKEINGIMSGAFIVKVFDILIRKI